MKNLLKEFKEFALRGNVMELAVAVIMGAAFQGIISSLTGDIISPVLGLFGGVDFSNLAINIGDASIRYGAFITAVINFIIMAFVIFLMVKGMNKLAGLSINGDFLGTDVSGSKVHRRFLQNFCKNKRPV